MRCRASALLAADADYPVALTRLPRPPAVLYARGARSLLRGDA